VILPLQNSGVSKKSGTSQLTATGESVKDVILSLCTTTTRDIACRTIEFSITESFKAVDLDCCDRSGAELAHMPRRRLELPVESQASPSSISRVSLISVEWSVRRSNRYSRRKLESQTNIEKV
jgi:hypothetical protein